MNWNQYFSRYFVSMSVWLLILFIGFLPIVSHADNLDSIAEDAFYNLEAKPFNRSAIAQSAQDISYVLNRDPENPWGLIAASRLSLELGYIKGDRSNKSTYSEEALKNADFFAEKALKYGPNIGMAHVQYSKMQIINGDLRDAWLTLNRAQQINNNDFYPWYYRAVISIKMKDEKRADSFLIEAGKRADRTYQKSWVAGRRIDVAKLIGDEAAIEDAYMKSIEVDPASPYRYGNYANYLKRKMRYKEAITYYENAIAISAYPMAIKGLEEARSQLNKNAD